MTQLMDRGPVVPDRTLVQRMDALAAANAIRTRRAQFKRDLKAGRVSVMDVLLNPPEWAETMKVSELLLAVPKVGRVNANKVLAAARASHSKTLAGMTDRQRMEVAAGLRSKVWC
jgi:hypothetical protein